MSDTKTAQETLAEYQGAMGDELGALFHSLSNELVWMRWQWAEFIDLFGTKPTRLEIANKTAPFFFRMIQRMFWDDALLGISRMAASPKSLNKPNLTFQRIAPLIMDDELRTIVSARTTLLVEQAAFAIDWRNRRIAHRDLDLALDRPAKPLSTATRQAVENWFKEAAEILNLIQSHYLNSTTAYTDGWRGNGATSLLYYLRDGLRREAERRTVRDRGEYRPELFNDDLGAV